MEKENETVKANKKMVEQLEDWDVHSASQGRNEAESANLQMRDQFRGKHEKPAEGVSPAYVYTPAINLNPEERD
jgi:hypothetical protein